MRHVIFFIVILSLFTCSVSAHSICSANEKVVWSCKNPKASYVVCASNDLSKNSGYLQYRATKNGKLALSFPDILVHPADVFKFSLLASGAMLSFESGGYMYEMFEGLAGMPSITISKAGKQLTTIQCADSDYALTLTETINRLKEAGILEADHADTPDE